MGSRLEGISNSLFGEVRLTRAHGTPPIDQCEESKTPRPDFRHDDGLHPRARSRPFLQPLANAFRDNAHIVASCTIGWLIGEERRKKRSYVA